MSQSKAKRVTKKKTPKSRANWGANESPRHCRNPACGSVNSDIVTTKNMTNPDRRVRYRKCLDCGRRFSTLDVIKGATA